MNYNIEVFSIFEYGKRTDSQGRPHQEDCLFPAHGEAKKSDRFFVLCDGMGGHDAGEVASATVCEAMGQSVLANCADAEGAFGKDDIQRALNAAFEALDEKDNGAAKKMGTTMTMLKLFVGGCYIAHMGDSRVYHIRPGKTAEETRILFHTEDHSLVNDLVRLGELTPEEARVSKQKNIITRAMQPKMEHRPKADIYHTADIEGGDYFYMCSDGMLEHMDDDNLRFIFSDEGGTVSKKVNTLVQGTCENRDNHSAIIIHVLGVVGAAAPMADDTKETATKPATEAIVPIAAGEKKDNGVQKKPNGGTKAPKTVSKGMLAARREQNRRRWLAALSLLLCIAIAAVVAYLFMGKGTSSEKETKQQQKGIIIYDEPTKAPMKPARGQTVVQSDKNDAVERPETTPGDEPAVIPESTEEAAKEAKEKLQQTAAEQHKEEPTATSTQQLATKVTQRKSGNDADAVDADAATANKSAAETLKEIGDGALTKEE